MKVWASLVWRFENVKRNVLPVSHSQIRKFSRNYTEKWFFYRKSAFLSKIVTSKYFSENKEILRIWSDATQSQVKAPQKVFAFLLRNLALSQTLPLLYQTLANLLHRKLLLTTWFKNVFHRKPILYTSKYMRCNRTVLCLF